MKALLLIRFGFSAGFAGSPEVGACFAPQARKMPKTISRGCREPRISGMRVSPPTEDNAVGPRTGPEMRGARSGDRLLEHENAETRAVLARVFDDHERNDRSPGHDGLDRFDRRRRFGLGCRVP